MAMPVAATAFMIVVVTMAAAAFVIVIVTMAMSAATLVPFIMTMSMPATALMRFAGLAFMLTTAHSTHRLQLATFKLPDGLLDCLRLRAIHLHALIKQAAQQPAVDAAAQQRIGHNRLPRLFDQALSGRRIENQQERCMRQMRFQLGQQAGIRFDGDTQFHDVPF